MDRFPELCRQTKTEIGILTVPVEFAQRVAEHEADMRNVYIRYAICLGIVVLWLVILFVALGVHLFKRRDKRNFMKYMKYYSVPMKN